MLLDIFGDSKDSITLNEVRQSAVPKERSKMML